MRKTYDDHYETAWFPERSISSLLMTGQELTCKELKGFQLKVHEHDLSKDQM